MHFRCGAETCKHFLWIRLLAMTRHHPNRLILKDISIMLKNRAAFYASARSCRWRAFAHFLWITLCAMTLMLRKAFDSKWISGGATILRKTRQMAACRHVPAIGCAYFARVLLSAAASPAFAHVLWTRLLAMRSTSGERLDFKGNFCHA